jgi:hypothetical protein
MHEIAKGGEPSLPDAPSIYWGTPKAHLPQLVRDV